MDTLLLTEIIIGLLIGLVLGTLVAIYILAAINLNVARQNRWLMRMEADMMSIKSALKIKDRNDLIEDVSTQRMAVEETLPRREPNGPAPVA